MSLERTGWLLGPAVVEVRELAPRATATDGVAPLSEQFLLDLDGERSSHLMAREGGRLVGYGQVAADGAVELVVDPDARRRGVGRSLVDAVLADEPGARFWAHGGLAPARALGADRGLEVVRELHRMARPVRAQDREPVGLPEGLVARSFVVGQDEQAWLELNATAFADHPEQGRMTLADLHERQAEAWFDPAGLVLVEDVSGDRPRLVASHWTKREPGWDEGEVYAVAVHPQVQGRGLAGPVTALGIGYLARTGARSISLYVDGDNDRALRTYRRAGFEIAATDVMLAHP